MYFYQLYIMVPFFFYSYKLNSCCLLSFGNSHSDTCEVYFIVVLICISLVVSDVEACCGWAPTVSELAGGPDPQLAGCVTWGVCLLWTHCWMLLLCVCAQLCLPL